MLNIPPFYHGLTRKVIVSFGSLFSNIKIQRQDNTGAIAQELVIPLTYAPKEKWLVRIEQDPALEKHTYITLPRMSFEITGMTYDATRKTSRMSKVVASNTDTTPKSLNQAYSPVPYNFDISLYVISKTQEDCLQIVEQILPFFTPEFTLSINAVPELDVTMDIPIILNSVNIEDNYDGSFQERRFVTYTINFTVKSNFYGPVSNVGPINTVFINDIGNHQPHRKYTAHGDFTTGTITSSWNDTF
jgi:hypothetical protein